MIDIKSYVFEANRLKMNGERPEPAPKPMTDREWTVFSSKLLPGNLYIGWLKNGGVVNEEGSQSAESPVPNKSLQKNFAYLDGACFMRGVKAMVALADKNEVIEDFAGILTPEAVGRLPRLRSQSWKGCLEYYYGPGGKPHRANGVY